MRIVRQVAGRDAYKVLTVRRLNGALGAELSGVDLSKPIGPDARREIRQALVDHLVVYFRGQPGFSRERHLEFARMFGPLQKVPRLLSVEGYPHVQIARREPSASRRDEGDGIHADSTFMSTPPTTVTMHCTETPDVHGGTAFANLQLAYEMLSPAMQKLLGSMRAVHSAKGPFGSQGMHRQTVMMEDMSLDHGDADVTHPVVRTHPVSRRKGLFVHAAYTQRLLGFAEEESQPLLQFLYQHAWRLEFICRIQWSKHMVLVWDTRCTHHSAIGGDDVLRHLERVTTGGEVPT